MSEGMLVFAGLVFLAVFLLAQGLIVPVFGESRSVRKRLQTRLRTVSKAAAEPTASSLLREAHLKNLSPLERFLEGLPGMDALGRMIEQAGKSTPACRVAGVAVLLGAAAGLAGWMLTAMSSVALLSAVAAFTIPLFKIARDRRTRMARLEEQMPEAIDVIRRALKAGHPFNHALKLAAEDMDGPIARELELTFADVNYGSDLRRAMLGLLERVPSVTVMAFVTSVLLQRETGGNLTEVLERIGAVLRGRFRFHRRVRTLSAEGRLSAWILALIPLVLFAVMWITTPDYLPMLLQEEIGRKLIVGAVVLGVIGLVWIRSIIRIDV